MIELLKVIHGESAYWIEFKYDVAFNHSLDEDQFISLFFIQIEVAIRL